MAKIFISYRRQDTIAIAHRTYAYLGEQLQISNNDIFFDRKSIQIGNNWVLSIEDALRGCELLLAIIGENWLSVADATGKPRILNDHDWVRHELRSALLRGINLIPILIGNATLPSINQLPSDIQGIVFQSPFRISQINFDKDAKVLSKQLLLLGYGKSENSNFDEVEKNLYRAIANQISLLGRDDKRTNLQIGKTSLMITKYRLRLAIPSEWQIDLEINNEFDIDLLYQPTENNIKKLTETIIALHKRFGNTEGLEYIRSISYC